MIEAILQRETKSKSSAKKSVFISSPFGRMMGSVISFFGDKGNSFKKTLSKSGLSIQPCQTLLNI